MATYIVGDIQACFTGLQRLLKKVQFCPSQDRLIAVGDLIGRGPAPLQTLDYLHSLGSSFTTVLGNHDLHLMAIFANIRQAHPSDNLDQLLTSPRIEQHINWLRAQPLALMANEHTLVTHAGLYPKWSVKQALSYSSEISQLLQAKDWQHFVANMYGNQPNSWQERLTGVERARFIVNALTRMRFVDQNLHLNFSCKVAPDAAPDSLTPWFNIHNAQLASSTTVVFGHWASLHGHTQNQQFVGLDTGYIWGQSMSLLNLTTGKIVSVKFQDP
ncbi:symmetrical bis(5'-nucleosyl)-tetraphosphatase [Paraglaciecola aestuariivivens]